MSIAYRSRGLGVLFLLLSILALSGGASTAAAQPSTPNTGDDERTMTVSVYFLRDEKIGAAHREIVIPEDKTVAASTIRELLAGPTDEEEDAGLSTAIPDDTELLGITIDAETKVATVDLSKPFESGGGSLALTARLAQVVYTLTQFPTIETVTFALEGQPIETFGGEGLTLDEPVDRTDYDDLTPLIFVESPTPGDAIESPVQIWGTANTFEATFMAQIVDAAGNTLAREVVTATSGSGTRGTFDVEIPFDPGESTAGTVVVYELSARDGSQINLVEIPVEFAS